jgi:DNA-binding NarL/FixJ family response regulator
MEKIRIMIADDNKSVRLDLSTILELDERIEVVGEAASGEDAVLLAGRLHPDAVFMDLEMPGIGGLEAMRQIKSHQSARAVLILTVHSYEIARQLSMNAGADSFIVKGTPVGVMVEQVMAVLGV